jgi:apolipoprotein N-acyltransferase
MPDAFSSVARRRQARFGFVASRVRVEAPTIGDWAAALLSIILLILSFPDFGFWPTAWLGLVPLIVVIAWRPAPLRAFALGWLTGTFFFYATCHWLTYSMINYGRLPGWLAYILLVPGAVILGLFPAAFAMVLARGIRRWQNKALFLAPFIWVALEWARLAVTGQLWNALGYSQAYQPVLIQSARWGGVYAISFLILLVNAAVAFLILDRSVRTMAISATVLVGVALLIYIANISSPAPNTTLNTSALSVVAIQPNVPMIAVSPAEMDQLTEMHFAASARALDQLPLDRPRLVIWPESPMMFTYGTDPKLQSQMTQFAIQYHTSLLFNSQEAAANGGLYNSAILINDQGREIAQYDKIRLMPFGEYVPLPRWVPGASLIRGIVGDFTPGDKYTLMPAGPIRAGVFICIEAAYPWVAQNLANEGAELLINISNDGYLGPTAVMRQHLANAIFRAVENGRPLLRVTNTGISAYISPTGEVRDETPGFQRATRIWSIDLNGFQRTFYTRYPNALVLLSAVISVLIFALTLRGIKKEARG